VSPRDVLRCVQRQFTTGCLQDRERSKLGEYQQARALDEDTLARRRRVLGHDHPDTLISANNLAADLRALDAPEQTCNLAAS
jgi:hypothetical protein